MADSVTIQLHPITPDDREFLYQVYASTRYEELAPLGWDAPMRDSFLTMQFNAQHQDYQGNYPNASFDLIVRDNVPVGRLYVDRRPDELHVIDIALLPEYRNQGIGSALLVQLIAEAEASNLPMRIYVERFNPASQLYTRLGFKPIGDTGVYLLMERPSSRVG